MKKGESEEKINNTRTTTQKKGKLKGDDKWGGTILTHVKQPKNGNLKAGGKWSKTTKTHVKQQ